MSNREASEFDRDRETVRAWNSADDDDRDDDGLDGFAIEAERRWPVALARIAAQDVEIKRLRQLLDDALKTGLRHNPSAPRLPRETEKMIAAALAASTTGDST